MEEDVYHSERRAAIDARYVEQRGLDRTLIYLAGGGLATALTFLRTAPAPFPSFATWLATGAAILFLASLIACVLSMRASVEAHDNYLGQLDRHYSEGAPFADVPEDLATMRYNKWALKSFVFGAALLAIAVILMTTI